MPYHAACPPARSVACLQGEMGRMEDGLTPFQQVGAQSWHGFLPWQFMGCEHARKRMRQLAAPAVFTTWQRLRFPRRTCRPAGLPCLHLLQGQIKALQELRDELKVRISF